MINPQLLEYVRAQRTAGLSKEAIVQALAQGGWTPQDVNEAFMAIDGVQTPPPPPPPRITPGPVAPRVVTPPLQPPVQPVQPAMPPIQPVGMSTQFPTTPTPRPVMASSEVATARVAPKKGHWLLYAIIGVVVLAVLALGAFAYLQPGFFLNMIGLSLPTPTPQIEDTGAQPLVPAESEPINIEPSPSPEATTTSAAASTTADVSTTTSPTGTTTSQ